MKDEDEISWPAAVAEADDANHINIEMSGDDNNFSSVTAIDGQPIVESAMYTSASLPDNTDSMQTESNEDDDNPAAAMELQEKCINNDEKEVVQPSSDAAATNELESNESAASNDDTSMKLTLSHDDIGEEDVKMSTSASESVPTSPTAVTQQQQQQQQESSNSNSGIEASNVSLDLTPEEERLFTLLINAADTYLQGELDIDPNPTEQSVSARGGFTKAAASTTTDKSTTDTTEEEAAPPSYLKLPPKVNNIEIRIAGGWVRDKLLHQHSVDVDVALDCMMGVQFARIVQSYLAKEETSENNNKEKDSEERMAIDDIDANQSQQQDVNKDKPPSQRGNEAPKKKKKKTNNKQPKIGVIGANPSQSKHLETATMNIHGIDVDFVNLRAEEVYEANSRIPTSKTRMFGTPLEDALRRDFTINSLFYNIRTRQVEDWTGRGLTDLLENRLIVTPVDPHETFHDDPLRVLRAIRFCVRLDFSLHDDIVQAAMSERVHHSLHVKVSRERVGKELEGMLTGKHAKPGRALDMVADLHLAGSVFAFPGSFPSDDAHVFGPVTGMILGTEYHGCCGKDGSESVVLAAMHRARGWEESSKVLKLLPQVMESHAGEKARYLVSKSEGKAVPSSALDPRLLHICAFILPFHNLTFPDAKGRDCSVTTHMIKEALKWSTKDIQAVSKILEHVDEMIQILSEIRTEALNLQPVADGVSAQLSPPCRLRAGLLLRSLKEQWVTCLLVAAAWELRSCQRMRDANDSSASTGAADDQPSRHCYLSIVSELELDECWRVRPHLNGKEIIKILGLPKGPQVGVYIEDQTKWMLLNPKGSKDECMVHLVEKKRGRDQEVAMEDDVIVDDQNEQNVGVAKDYGKSSPSNADESKHISKKIRSDDDMTSD